MKLRRHAVAFLAGTGLFMLQVLVTAQANFGGLTPRAAALLTNAAHEAANSPAALLWLTLYLGAGIITHCIPVALALKIVDDLRHYASNRVRWAANHRGFSVLAVVAFALAPIMWNRHLFPAAFCVGAPNCHLPPYTTALTVTSTTLVAAYVLTWLAVVWSRRGLALLFPAALFLLLPALALAPQRDALLRQPASKDLPNIILIGIDSLRPDHLSGAGAPESFTPTIDSFIAQAVVFDHAHTPMGRTFVALMSVISGQYPIRHGARENLYPRSLVRTDDLLTSRLQKNGYTTIFSIDDVRFANIDQSFGFDRVASPQPGVVEILASTVSNTAGTNLIQLLPGAHILLPHTAANRAIPSSYAPHLYARRLSRHIHATPTESPLFLLAHFTLPHSPFALGSWRNEHLSAAYVDSPASYRKALAMADAQVQDVLTLLRNAGRLDNALVVLFSDHGEGLGMKKDRWKVSSSLRDGVAPSDFGHGGTAVDDSQNRILISLQRYEGGTAVWQHARTPGAASLVDISPTVTQVTGIAVDPNQFDGTSLVSYDGAPAIHKSRPVFVESGIFGGSLRALHPDPASVINEFAHVYRVTPDLRAELKQEHLPTLLRDKERGVIYDGFAVAATPTLDGEGCWTKAAYAQRTIDCFNSRHLDPVVLQYSSLVCTHFVEDVDFFRQWCVANVHSEATISP